MVYVFIVLKFLFSFRCQALMWAINNSIIKNDYTVLIYCTHLYSLSVTVSGQVRRYEMASWWVRLHMLVLLTEMILSPGLSLPSESAGSFTSARMVWPKMLLSCLRSVKPREPATLVRTTSNSCTHQLKDISKKIQEGQTILQHDRKKT